MRPVLVPVDFCNSLGKSLDRFCEKAVSRGISMADFAQILINYAEFVTLPEKGDK